MYGNPYVVPPIQNYGRMEQPQQQMMNQTYTPPVQPQVQKPFGLLGKLVDSVDVVKVTDIPLDGSISYFPVTDGSAIVTKKLQADGTAKTTIYKPIENDQEKQVEFATLTDIEDAIKDIDLSEFDDLRDEIKEIRKELKELKSKK